MTVSHDEFVNTVAERGDLETQQQAQYAARATLITFSERISHGASEDIAETLPTGIRDAVLVDESEDPESFSPDEFIKRVEDRERDYPELNLEHTRRHVEAVLTTLRDESTEPFEQAVSQLPNEYERLYQLPP